MGVAIDKAGHDDAAGGIDFDGKPGFGEIFDAARGSNFNEEAIANENRAIGDHADVV